MRIYPVVKPFVDDQFIKINYVAPAAYFSLFTNENLMVKVVVQLAMAIAHTANLTIH